MRGEGASELDVESATGLTFKDVHAATVRHSEEWFESFDSEEFDAHQVTPTPSQFSIIFLDPRIPRKYANTAAVSGGNIFP